MTQATPSLRWQDLPNAPALGSVLCTTAELPASGAHLVQFAAAPGSRPFGVVVLSHAGSVRAYANRCAHFGVPLAAKVEQLPMEPGVSLSCNVHYARYRWDDGVCDRGDCEGERLLPMALEIDAQGVVRLAHTSEVASA